MKKALHDLSEIVAKANDLFYEKFTHIDTLMGIMDKTLRAQGMQADAITIDCITLKKKIVLLIHDDKPDTVDIALGNKDGDIYSSSQYPLKDLSASAILDIMTSNFADNAS
jgi:hypothetical protein